MTIAGELAHADLADGLDTNLPGYRTKPAGTYAKDSLSGLMAASVGGLFHFRCRPAEIKKNLF